MKTRTTIVDYGIGNLLSVTRAFEFCGSEVLLTNNPNDILLAERLVLPGVGAFADGMDGLKSLGLVQAITEFAKSGRPFLGICLGMQMIMEVGEEFGIHQGLGLIPGRVVAIPSSGKNGQPHKIPHIGWNNLLPSSANVPWADTILNGIHPESETYFVHSLTAVPQHDMYRLADCSYNGRLIAAIIKRGNIYGCQFHPEKSGKVGLQILRNFLSLKPITGF